MQTADRHVRARIAASLQRRNIPQFKAGSVDAYVNNGRWVADCPCNGAELVTPGHTMLCGSCGAESEVVFPSNQAKAVRLLEKRPVANQNWNPSRELVSDLLAQNIEHGLEV